MKTYIQEIKKRVELVKDAFDEPLDLEGNPQKLHILAREFHVRNLLDYLESIDALEEKLEMKFDNPEGNWLFDVFKAQEKWKFCPLCGRPLYQRKDGSLFCMELHK